MNNAVDPDQVTLDEAITQKPQPARKNRFANRERHFEQTPDLEQFFSDRLDEGLDYEIKLYRIDTSKTPTLSKYVGRYPNTIPQEEDIAREHGARKGENHYRASAWDRKQKTTHIKEIWIDESLHRLYEDAHPVSVPEVGTLPQQQSFQGPDPYQALSVIMKDVVSPILNATLKNVSPQPAQPPPAQTVDYFQKTMEGVVTTLTKGLKQMGETVMENQMNKISGPAIDVAQPGTKSFDIAQEIFQVIKMFGAKFLESKQGKSQEALKGLMQDFMNIDPNQVDDQAFNLVYNLCVQDKTIGKAKADELFKKAGFQVPETV